MLRRFLCSCSAGATSSSPFPFPLPLHSSPAKKNVVFLGSPQVSASVLHKLIAASEASDAIFKLAAVVTQPPSTRDRGRKKLMPSAVAQLALDLGFPQELIFTPERAGEADFLSDLKGLNPDLCITAAYGNILPQRFLDIPLCGTVNIHPSLLPLYRGAAPVQRALQDGVTETGVSLAYTIRALDAGPVIAYEKTQVDDSIKTTDLIKTRVGKIREDIEIEIKKIEETKWASGNNAPELLSILFDLGSGLLIRELPFILDGSAKEKALPQDDSKATLAPKLTSEESWLLFDQEATVLHNKVRAFAGWPGTRAKFYVSNSKNNGFDLLDIKVISTRVCHEEVKTSDKDEILFSGDALQIPCAGNSWLEVTELQLPGKKVTRARDFWNGLRGQKLKKQSQLEILV